MGKILKSKSQMTDCIFCQIANRLDGKTADFHYEDDEVVAFSDINPQAPVHILILPKNHIATIDDVAQDHQALLGKMILVAQELARAHHINEAGYRLIFNVKTHGGQVVDHIHLHLLGGKPLGKMIS